MKALRLTALALILFSFFTPNSFAAKKKNESKAKSTAKASAKSGKKSSKKQKESKDRPEAVDFNAKDVWDVDIFRREDHKVLVIQDRKYNKDGRLELSLHTVYNSSSPYYNSFGGAFGINYHLSEYLGVGASASFNSGTRSKEGKRLDDFLGGSGFSSQSETKRPDIFADITATWSPVYGKFAFFRSSIIHFDFYGEAGFAYLQDKSIYLPNDSVGNTNKQMGMVYGLGTKVFLSKSWMWRLGWKHYIYWAKFNGFSSNLVQSAASTTVLSAFQFSTGVSYLINLGGF